ncbi:MAG: hypothetical protein M3142_07005, partial [Bacteroidota bacterium]|nr:hypothetical protein [Bacteroidota bacterium]
SLAVEGLLGFRCRRRRHGAVQRAKEKKVIAASPPLFLACAEGGGVKRGPPAMRHSRIVLTSWHRNLET